MLAVNNRTEWKLWRSEGIEEGENDCNGILIFTNRKYNLDNYNPDTNNLVLRKNKAAINIEPQNKFN